MEQECGVASADSAAGLSDAIDIEDAMERVGGDRELLLEIADIFLCDCPELMAQLRRAVESRDAAAIRESAHSLKGAAGNLGAKPTYEAAMAMELAATEGGLDNINDLWESFRREVARLTDALRGLIAAGASW